MATVCGRWSSISMELRTTRLSASTFLREFPWCTTSSRSATFMSATRKRLKKPPRRWPVSCAAQRNAKARLEECDMEQQGQVRSQHGLEAHGIRNANTVWWNLCTPALYEHAIQ